MDQKNPYNTDEMEINLLELCAYIVRKGRYVLLCALIGMILLGAYKGNKLKGAFAASSGSVEAKDDYQDELALYNSQKEAAETQIDNISGQIKTQQEYKEQSILMNINPYSEYRDTTSYYIATDYQIMPGMDYQNVDPVPSLLKAYENVIGGQEVYDAVADAFDHKVSLWSVQELISVDTGITQNTVKYDNSRVFTVTTVGDTQELADNLMSAVKKQIEEYQPQIASSVSAHELREIDSSSQLTVDSDLQTKLTNFSNNIANLQQSLATTQQNLSKLEEPAASASGSRRAAAKSILKYAALGLIAGIFLSACWFAVQFLMSAPIPGRAELEDRYGLVVFGELAEEKKGFFQKLSDMLRGISRKAKSGGQQLDLISEYITGLKEKPANIAVVGGGSTERENDLISALASKIDGTALHYCGDITVSAQSMKAMNQADAVMLLLDMDHMSARKLQEILKICHNCGKAVFGTVLCV